MVWVTKVPAASSSFQVVVGLTLTCNSQHPELRHCSSPHSCSQSKKTSKRDSNQDPFPKTRQNPWWWTDNWDILGGGFRNPKSREFPQQLITSQPRVSHQHPWPSNALPSAELLLPAEASFDPKKTSAKVGFSLPKKLKNICWETNGILFSQGSRDKHSKDL